MTEPVIAALKSRYQDLYLLARNCLGQDVSQIMIAVSESVMMDINLKTL